MLTRGSAVPLVALVLLAVTEAACSSPTPTTPAVTTPPLPTVTGITIGGVPTAFSYRESIQLTAIVTLQGGSQKQALDATWQSSDVTVATVTPTGLLSVTGFGDADVTATYQSVQATAHVTLPKPPAPSARLIVTIDSYGSSIAISDASEITFDMSGSTGFGLRYDVAFGDGSSSSDGPTTKHVYGARNLTDFTVRATVTDGLGRTDTVAQTVSVVSLAVHSVHGSATWNNGFRFIRITSQDRLNVEGDSWFPYTQFTGTLRGDGNIHLVLGDGSITFDGRVIMKDVRAGGSYYLDRHMVLKVRGGPDDGLTLDLKFWDPY